MAGEVRRTLNTDQWLLVFLPTQFDTVPLQPPGHYYAFLVTEGRRISILPTDESLYHGVAKSQTGNTGGMLLLFVRSWEMRSDHVVIFCVGSKLPARSRLRLSASGDL